ncbi:hypothetical protein [Streptomyces sp. NBC_00576]|uniref:hypothetical protein n=1 Tax=Streptomyces sp. NBC_00576 TaxID=2903665 RepID=UPI002E81C431|nr:hypothetical protein [Streptomyces sp. NBC_00576]WUB70579.1 hypothetical protein OG734_11055 [Streptomyces sp. NBC_00576]
MKTTAKRLTAVAGGLVMAAGALTVGSASTAAAATCHGGAASKTFSMGTDQAEHRFGPYTTTSRCSDINLKITSWGNASPLVVRVCFHPSSGGTTCNSWKEFYKSSDLNQWRVIASDVRDGTKYSVSMDLASNTFKGDLAH